MRYCQARIPTGFACAGDDNIVLNTQQIRTAGPNGSPGLCRRGQSPFSPTQAQTTQMAVGAAASDIDVHIHALGERVVHQALNAIEAA